MCPIKVQTLFPILHNTTTVVRLICLSAFPLPTIIQYHISLFKRLLHMLDQDNSAKALIIHNDTNNVIIYTSTFVHIERYGHDIEH